MLGSFGISCLVFILQVIFSEQQNVTVTTTKGPIIGIQFNPNSNTGVSYDAFLGIPYGNVPARFQLAVAASTWTAALVTQTDGPKCPQPDEIFSENCLYLNVFTPLNASVESTTTTYPVIVFIHGAGFTAGSSHSSTYGPDFLVNSSVILVTMNYRLGAAGFLTLGSAVAPGNLGLHDTLLALQWVQDEIAAFGGNPAQVTLSGHSSGSVMTQYHYLSPLSSDLFARAVAMSGSATADWSYYTVTEGRRRALVLANALGCDTSQNDSVILACLQNANMSEIASIQSSADGILTDDDKINGAYRTFLPVLDTSSTATTPFFNDTLANLMAQALVRSKPMITGTVTEEGILKFGTDYWRMAEGNLSAFIPNSIKTLISDETRSSLANSIKSRYFADTVYENKVRSLVDLYSHLVFTYPSIQVSKYFANMTYGYLFAYDGSWASLPWYFSKYGMKGVDHGDENNYIFYMATNKPDLSSCSSNKLNLQVKDLMVKWYTTFAKTGTPSTDGEWPTISDGGYLVINMTAADQTIHTATSALMEDIYYSFWADMVDEIMNKSGAPRSLSQLSAVTVLVIIWRLVVSPQSLY